jgi:hypothetical protein
MKSDNTYRNSGGLALENRLLQAPGTEMYQALPKDDNLFPY